MTAESAPASGFDKIAVGHIALCLFPPVETSPEDLARLQAAFTEIGTSATLRGKALEVEGPSVGFEELYGLGEQVLGFLGIQGRQCHIAEYQPDPQ